MPFDLSVHKFEINEKKIERKLKQNKKRTKTIRRLLFPSFSFFLSFSLSSFQPRFILSLNPFASVRFIFGVRARSNSFSLQTKLEFEKKKTKTWINIHRIHIDTRNHNDNFIFKLKVYPFRTRWLRLRI